MHCDVRVFIRSEKEAEPYLVTHSILQLGTVFVSIIAPSVRYKNRVFTNAEFQQFSAQPRLDECGDLRPIEMRLVGEVRLISAGAVGHAYLLIATEATILKD